MQEAAFETYMINKKILRKRRGRNAFMQLKELSAPRT